MSLKTKQTKKMKSEIKRVKKKRYALNWETTWMKQRNDWTTPTAKEELTTIPIKEERFSSTTIRFGIL